MTTMEQMEVAEAPVVAAQTSQFIDVFTCFDTYTIKKIPNPSQDPQRPSGVSNSLIYMTTRQDRIIGESGAELNVKAAVGDTLRWREATLSLGAEDQVLFYYFEQIGGGTNLITIPQLIPSISDVPVPKPSGPPYIPPTFQEFPDHYWQSTVRNYGDKVTYRFRFALYERSDLVGYFHWDPYITTVKRA